MSKDEVSVRFLTDRVVADERAGTPDEERYEKDKIYPMSPLSARHWIERGFAVEAPAEVKNKSAPAAAVKDAVSRPKAQA